jgi:Skp family chaperone for outer membrane proteins
VIRKNISYLIFISLLSFQLCISQKSERIGYINMEYILSQMEDYKLANQQLEEKIGKWKKEIESKKDEIEILKDSLLVEKPLLTFDIIRDRESEIAFEEKQLNDYQIKRFGVNGDWVAQELMLIRPIQDQVMNVVQTIAEQKKFDKIFDQSADAIMLYSEKKYDISDLVLKSILRTEKLEKLNIEFEDESFNPEYEARKKLIEEKKAKKAEEVNSKRELLLKQREEKRKHYQRKRDSLLKLRKEKKTLKKVKK